MTLHIINLPHRTDRLLKLREELADQGITDFRIWDGIIHPTSPKTGISQAHKQIIQYALEKELSEILIAEDDVKFTAPGAFAHFMINKPKLYDLYLGGISYGNLKEDKTVEDFAGLLLYMVHERFYRTFLSINEKQHIDRGLRDKGRYIVCDPQPAIEQDGHSDNWNQYFEGAIFYKNRRLFGR